MAAIRYFRVNETREVVVAASDPAEAVDVANRVFRTLDESPKFDEKGRVLTGPVRTTDISATEE